MKQEAEHKMDENPVWGGGADLPAADNEMNAGEDGIRIKVKLFATLRPYLGEGISGTAVEMKVPAGTTLGQLAEILSLPMDEVKICFVNGRICELGRVLENGDEVGIFPPVGGG